MRFVATARVLLFPSLIKGFTCPAPAVGLIPQRQHHLAMPSDLAEKNREIFNDLAAKFDSDALGKLTLRVSNSDWSSWGTI